LDQKDKKEHVYAYRALFADRKGKFLRKMFEKVFLVDNESVWFVQDVVLNDEDKQKRAGLEPDGDTQQVTP